MVAIVLPILDMVLLGNHGVINAMGIVWGPQRPYHYVSRVPGLVFSVPDATVASIYKSRIPRIAASTFVRWIRS